MRDMSISHWTVCLMHGLCLQAYSQWLDLSLLPGLDFLPVGRLGRYSSEGTALRPKRKVYGTLRSSSVGEANYAIRVSVCVLLIGPSLHTEMIALDVPILWRIVVPQKSGKVYHNANFPNNFVGTQSFR